ncbi:MAG: acyl carrier protein [Verrucomicrobia bacterium]|nr:acyl carrier protein [Verrucomicrobiota bacterium]
MTRLEFKTIVGKIIETDPARLAADTELRKLGGFDSLNILTLMIELDERFEIRLEPEEVAALKVYGDLERLMAAHGAPLTD